MRYRSYSDFHVNSVWIILAINIVLFLAILAVPKLVVFLGLQPASVLRSPWTLITSMFVHGSFWHVIANMLTLYFFGTYLLMLVGEGRFLLTYFGGGILGNILFLFLASPFSIGIGASGAVYSLGGALMVMRPTLKVYVFPIPVPIPLWAAVIGGFLIISFLPHIAWQVHLGGLVFGLIAGYFFRRRERRYSS